jgi:hypothetical protein
VRDLAKLHQPKEEEEEEKFVPEVKFFSRIKDLMQSTGKTRNLVITALKSSNWDPESAFLSLMEDYMK